MKRVQLSLFVLFFLVACFPAFANEAKVLVVMPNSYIREAIVLRLQIEGYHNIVQESCANIDPASGQIDHLVAKTSPDYIIVDGTGTNAADGLLIDSNVLKAALEENVKRVFVLSSFAIYPEKSPLPFHEDQLTKLKSESMADPWQIGKISALKQCMAYNGLKSPRFFFCTFPLICGPHDTGFHIKAEHPLKNIAARILRAKVQQQEFAVISNDGEARYEMMHVDDLASALVFLLGAQNEDMVINIGYGQDTYITKLAQYVKGYLKFPGKLIFDVNSFDTVPRLVLDTRRLENLGWQPSFTTQSAVKDTVLWLESVAPARDPLQKKEFVLP